jgi:predicted deacylase
VNADGEAPKDLPGTGYPVELTAPDLSAYRGNTGIDYVTSLDSGRAGPHVMVLALVHGNELCGAHAIDFLFREGVRPVRGVLTLAFANVAAYREFRPDRPAASRFLEEDMNRVWDRAVLDGARQSVELRRARELRPAVDRADFLLDLHSMQHATPPLVLCGPTAKGRALAQAIGFPGYVVADAGHAAGRRLRDYGGFGDPGSPKNALLVECGQHWERGSAEVAIEATLRFLAHFALIDPAFVARRLAAAPLPAQRVIEVTDAVTVESDRFLFVEDYRGMEVIPARGTVIAHDGTKEVRTPYADCVLIMPSRRLSRGQTAVRLGRFVR